MFKKKSAERMTRVVGMAHHASIEKHIDVEDVAIFKIPRRWLSEGTLAIAFEKIDSPLLY